MSAPVAPPVRVTAVVVSYRSAGEALAVTLDCLAAARDDAVRSGALALRAIVVDNSDGGTDTQRLRALVGTRDGVTLSATGSNVGFGRANNHALDGDASDFVAIVNPDVAFAPDTIRRAVARLQRDPALVMVVPRVFGFDDVEQFLIKRRPALVPLVLRAFAPAALRQRCDALLAHYEWRDVDRNLERDDIEIASGSFMVLRGDAWRALHGFDPGYFLYFEDYDLSLRALAHGRILYDPSLLVRHGGGQAARKGFAHIRMFGASMLRFFRAHGWRLLR